jgi:hypothetical protein
LEWEPDIIQTCRLIGREHQAMRFQQRVIDPKTADAILTVFDGLTPANRESLASLSVPLLIKAARKLTSEVGSSERGARAPDREGG